MSEKIEVSSYKNSCALSAIAHATGEPIAKVEEAAKSLDMLTKGDVKTMRFTIGTVERDSRTGLTSHECAALLGRLGHRFALYRYRVTPRMRAYEWARLFPKDRLLLIGGSHGLAAVRGEVLSNGLPKHLDDCGDHLIPPSNDNDTVPEGVFVFLMRGKAK